MMEQQAALKVGDLIRIEPDGPVHKVEMVNYSRAYCTPIQGAGKVHKMKTLEKDTGDPLTKEFEERRGVNISANSLVEHVSEEEAKSHPGRRVRPSSTTTTTDQESNMSAVEIPVAGKSNRAKNKERMSANARKRADRHAGIGGKRAAATRTNGAAKKPKSVSKCRCGCGEETLAFFAPGHDARFKGWLKKIATGKAKPEDLMNKGTRESYKWVKKGEGLVPTTNYKGEPYKG